MPGYLVGEVPTAPASSITVIPNATLLANNVQSALEEIDKEVTYSATAPTSPNTGDLWVDVSNPLSPIIKAYSGTTWIIAAASGDEPDFTLIGA